MAKKSNTPDDRQEQSDGTKAPRRRGPTIKREKNTSQLLEAGEGPDDPVGSFEGSPSEFTTDGGPGTATPERYGGAVREDDEPPNPRASNTGGEGGYSTIAGGTYYGEGSYSDAPNHGDWGRHPTGAGSGARGQEGYSYPGEPTWGESQLPREQEEATGRPPGADSQSSEASEDTRIRDEIRRRLTDRFDLDASGIEVQVEGGEVTLAGTVAERDARWLAEDLLESISGVSLVHNHLRLSDR